MGERRIAAFGGTFDPIHNGHVEIARAVVRNFGIDRLLIIPAHRPPHKNERAIVEGYHRFAMAVLATLDEPRLVVSTIELESPDRPYTFETIERLRNTFGSDTRLFFVMGADSFEEIRTWREHERLLSRTSVIAITRPGHNVDSSHLDERFRANIVDLRSSDGKPELAGDLNEHRIFLAGYVDNGVSSTEIRQRVRDGEPIDQMVPARVAGYIEKYDLYRR